MAAMSTPAIASRPPFETAHRRLAAYLRLCGLSPAPADRLGATLLDEAGGPGSRDAQGTALGPALAGSFDRIDAWAGGLVPEQAGESPSHRGARGRTVVGLAHVAERWPESFLAPTPEPAVREAASHIALPLSPPLNQTVMTPQPLELGHLKTVADETWRTFDKWPFMRGLVIWTLFFALIGGAFYLVRF